MRDLTYSYIDIKLSVYPTLVISVHRDVMNDVDKFLGQMNQRIGMFWFLERAKVLETYDNFVLEEK